MPAAEITCRIRVEWGRTRMSDRALTKSVEPFDQLDLVIREASNQADDLRLSLVSAHLSAARDALNNTRPKRTI